jgi:hypothetical protein
MSDAPRFNAEIFRRRQRGDQLKTLNRSIKAIETYMKKLGSNQMYWDDAFLGFLSISDAKIIKALNA